MENMRIFAKDAQMMAEIANQPVSAWDKLFERIKEEAQNGRYYLLFNEEKEKVRFVEPRKEVKAELEKMGYEVEYSKERDDDSYGWSYGESYHNVYRINWYASK